MIYLWYDNKDMSSLQKRKIAIGFSCRPSHKNRAAGILQGLQKRTPRNPLPRSIRKNKILLPWLSFYKKIQGMVFRLVKKEPRENSSPRYCSSRFDTGRGFIALWQLMCLLRRINAGFSCDRSRRRGWFKAAPRVRPKQPRILSVAQEKQLAERIPNTMPQLQLGETCAWEMPSPEIGAHSDTICLAERLLAKQEFLL